MSTRVSAAKKSKMEFEGGRDSCYEVCSRNPKENTCANYLFCVMVSTRKLSRISKICTIFAYDVRLCSRPLQLQ